MNKWRWSNLFVAGLLTACGGGGGGGMPPDISQALGGIDMVLPTAASLDAPASFKLSGTLPADLQATWEFGDGTQASGLSVDHDYRQSGALSVTLRLSLPSGASRVLTRPLQVATWSFLRDPSCTAGVKGGWCAVPAEMTSQNLESVAFADADTGWAAAGEWIMSTQDGGRQWRPTHLPFAASSLMAVDKSTVLALARWPIPRAALSEDGGRSFVDIPMPELDANGPRALTLQKDGLLVVASWGVKTFASRDRGKTWQAGQWDKNVPYLANGDVQVGVQGDEILRFDSLSMGLWRLIGRELQRSQDGGVSYQRAAEVPAGCGASALKVYGSRLLVHPQGADAGGACVSPDGGAHWQALPALPPGEVSDVGIRADGGYYSRTAEMQLAATTPDLGAWTPLGSVPGPTGVQIRSWCSLSNVLDPRSLVADCSNSRGSRWTEYSLDGGATWLRGSSDVMVSNELDLSRRQLSSGITIRRSYNTYTGYEFVAKEGALWVPWQIAAPRFSKDGSLWHPWDLPTPLPYQGDAVYLDARTVARQSRSDARYFQLSRDAGKTWASLDLAGVDYLSVDASGGLWRRLGPSATLEVSRDVGQTFQTVLPAGKSDGYTALDTRRADWWLMGGANITSSTDGGKTWTWTALATPVSHVLTMDGARGLAMVQAGYGPRGQACVLLTQDRGLHWSPCIDIGTDRRINAVTYQGDTVWAVGHDGVMRVSRDAGQTWKPVNLGVPDPLNDVRFATAQRGWAVGDQGLLLSTRDGGQTWVRAPRLTQSDLRRISIVNEQMVWIAGTDILLGTSTGGE